MRSPAILVVLVLAMTAVLGCVNAEEIDPSAVTVIPVPAETNSTNETVIPVSAATSVTIYEQTGWVTARTFSVDTLMGPGAVFYTVAQIYERYTVTSDGTYLTIHCYRYPPSPPQGLSVGNNIVAAVLNGVNDTDGVWASIIVDCQLGDGGIDSSKWNALGNVSQVGPFLGSPCTYLGDYDSEIVLGFSIEPTMVIATIEVVPDEVDVNGTGRWNGEWMSVYIELPQNYSVSEIDLSSVALNGIPVCERNNFVGDYDDDGIPDLRVRVSKADILSSSIFQIWSAVFGIGNLNDGTVFADTCYLTIADP